MVKRKIQEWYEKPLNNDHLVEIIAHKWNIATSIDSNCDYNPHLIFKHPATQDEAVLHMETNCGIYYIVLATPEVINKFNLTSVNSTPSDFATEEMDSVPDSHVYFKIKCLRDAGFEVVGWKNRTFESESEFVRNTFTPPDDEEDQITVTCEHCHGTGHIKKSKKEDREKKINEAEENNARRYHFVCGIKTPKYGESPYIMNFSMCKDNMFDKELNELVTVLRKIYTCVGYDYGPFCYDKVLIDELFNMRDDLYDNSRDYNECHIIDINFYALVKNANKFEKLITSLKSYKFGQCPSRDDLYNDGLFAY